MPPHVLYVNELRDTESLEDIHLSDEITSVVCQHLKVTSFPSHWGEQLKEFTCLDCLYVTELPESYVKLIRLNCSGCINLRSIPLYPLLEILQCVGCINLTTLPPFFNLKQLYCQLCYSLVDLPNFLFVTVVYCYHCPNLQTVLPTWPSLIELYTDRDKKYKREIKKNKIL